MWFSLPDCRVASLGLGKVQYYSTSGNSKDGPPKSASGDAPSAEKVLSGAAKATPAPSGDKMLPNTLLRCLMSMWRCILCNNVYYFPFKNC